MFRIVTRYRNGSTHPVVERGPWHPSRESAEFWRKVLRDHGYIADIETQRSDYDASQKNDNSALAEALASMA